ncbi:polysaccharide biosynthesis/export family protein [Pseudomonadota bacterium]
MARSQRGVSALWVLFLAWTLGAGQVLAQQQMPIPIPNQNPNQNQAESQEQDPNPYQLDLNSPIPPLEVSDSTYRLLPSDRFRVNVFNQPDLSGDYQLDGEGQFVMPLLGRIDVEGLTSAEVEILLTNRLRPDYLVNPRIFVQVLNYRPYYLIGESAGRGPFPYVAGMTYLTAIARSGGYSYRAKKGFVYVIRAGDPEQQEIKLSVNEIVQPGDIIRVAERMF